MGARLGHSEKIPVGIGGRDGPAAQPLDTVVTDEKVAGTTRAQRHVSCGGCGPAALHKCG
jgi:hypothetical protein